MATGHPVGAGALPALATYSPSKLFYLALGSDTVIHARITRVDQDFYFAQNLAAPRALTIKVQQFKSWECAQRWKKYVLGQEVLLFLRKEKEYYSIMSPAGGEGEMMVEHDSVWISCQIAKPHYAYFIDNHSRLVPDSLNKNLRRNERGYAPFFVLPMSVLLNQVKLFQACYVLRNKYEPSCDDFVQLQTDAAIKPYLKNMLFYVMTGEFQQERWRRCDRR